MDLLTVNDTPGQYPQSWYAHTANHLPVHPTLNKDLSADVCIIGGGYTGLSTALHLAEAGVDCIVLEANRIGWGASGRNGGQVGIGFNKSQDWLEKELGVEAAKGLWQLGLDGAQLVEKLVTTHEIDCDLQSGILYPTHSKREFTEYVADNQRLQENYEAGQIKILDKSELANWLATDAYCGALLNNYARHLHPLNYALGLAQAAEAAGARLFENSRVEQTQLPWLRSHVSMSGNRVQTANGSVKANHIVFACNGYLNDLHPDISKQVMPINNYIVATEPLPEQFPEQLIANKVAVADSRFVVNYFRLSHDNRLLFGGGETWGYKFPDDPRALVSRSLLEIFPQLKDVSLDFAWGGTLAITRSRLPCLTQPGKRVWNASGYSGHGVALATLSGKLIADAIQGRKASFDLLASLPCDPFPGGTRLRPTLLKLGMLWYATRDRIGL